MVFHSSLGASAASATLRTLDAHDLATVLHKSAASIKNDLSRAPHRLPPPIMVGRKTIWLESSVLAWLTAQTRQPAQAQLQMSRRRGRPTKVEQARRERVREAEREQEGGEA
jgi:predicted DNA-binding transcriptional regulator AlpA